MTHSVSKDRAAMPTGATAVLDKRSLAASNANLLSVLAPGRTGLVIVCKYQTACPRYWYRNQSYVANARDDRDER